MKLVYTNQEIREIMYNYGITQERLAEEIGSTQVTISRFLHNEFKMRERVYRLAISAVLNQIIGV